jgi:MFS family permease
METALAYPGWGVVAASAFGVMFGYAVLVPYTFGLFVKPLSAEFGWRRDQISLALTCVALTVALCAALIGWLVDRIGPRRVIVTCSLAFGASFASLAFLSAHIVQLYATFVLLGLAGNGTTQLAYLRAACAWFARRRGLALSIISGGAGAGAMILPFATALLIGRLGWRAAYGILGTAVIVVGVPLAFFFVRQPDRNLRAVNQSASADGDHLRQPKPFILLILAIFFYSISFNAIISHLAPLLTDRGLRLDAATAALSLVGAFGLAGRILTGYLLDRHYAVRVSMVFFLGTIAALLLIASGSVAGAYAGAALLGFTAGGESDITPYLLSRYYPLFRFSFLYGCAWTAFAAGTAIGPFLMGVLFARTGSYKALGTQMFALPTLISAALMAFMPRYAPSEPIIARYPDAPVLSSNPVVSDS